ncbi:hypothetical protein [Clostridium sp. ZS2-4]|uniref:hypothetical protein n=1 Tax=Clostridium sp. ZS2-4 TaxID=2987703 RepID=UPI00227A0D42|nr:hypothetical protein [Clostridium sp. ZS2-4]MCY6355411.1 hypothetical protein [Clostridium sp. ZS2-4]
MDKIYNINNKKSNNIHDLEEKNIGCNEVGFDCIPNENNGDNMTLVEFIRKNYKGARIVIRLRSGIFVAGEVVDGFDNVISLRTSRGRIFYIDGEVIDFFF